MRTTMACIQFPKMLKTLFLGCFTLAITLVAGQAQAVTCTSVAGAVNWNAPASWTGCVGGNGTPANTPGTADAVIILNNSTVTVNALGLKALSVTVNTGGNASTLTFASGSSLDVTNDVNINGATGGVNKSITVLTGTLTVGGNVTATAGSTNGSISQLTVTSGSIAITGNVTLNGGANANRDALLSASTGSITIDGGLTINSTVATSSTVSITGAGTITVNGAAGVTNHDTVTIGAGTFNVTNATATFTNSDTAIVANTTVSTGLLNISGGLTNGSTGTNTGIDTITLSSTGTITVGGTLTNNTGTTNGTITTTTGTVNANGDFLNNGVFTHSAAGQLNLRGTNATMNGTFTRTLTTGTVTSNKLTAGTQNLSGTALAFSNFVMNSVNGVTLGANATVNTLLTLTTGVVTTGANTLIVITVNCATSVTSTNGWVNGNLQKHIPAGASSCTFEVGGASASTPIAATFVAGAAASNITAKSTDGDHPNIATSGLDPNLTANRFWSLTSTVAEATAFSAIFNFVAGDRDTDTQPTTLFIGRQFSGGVWTTPTTGALTATSTQLTGLTLAVATQKDFAVGEAARATGTESFNAVENIATSGLTAGDAVNGKIFTKLAGTTFTIDLVAMNSARTAADTTFKGIVKVELLDSSSSSTVDINGCNAGWPIIQTLAVNPQFLSADMGRKQNVSFTENKAWPNARVRVSFPATGAATLIGCSKDNFSIRPSAFTVTSTNATQTDNTGLPTFTAASATAPPPPPPVSANFNLTATAVVGYNGTPSVDNTAGMVIGTPAAGIIVGSFTAAPIATGIASGVTFTYSEVGNFGLNTNAVHDDTFTSVDSNTECTPDFSNTLVGGKYGCKIGSTAVALNVAPSGTGFGRFIPDNFLVNVKAPAPQFTTACAAGAFTYVGQTFLYDIVPVLQVTARNSSNSTTANYAGAYMKITNATLTPNTTAARYSRFDVFGGGTTPALDTSGVPAAGVDPVIGTFALGVGTLTFGSGTGLQFTRSTTTPNAQFNADIALALNVIDADGVAFGSNPATFGAATANNGIAFSVSAGNNFRYGRLKLSNANGSELLNLPVPMQTQYWNGTAFVTNAADSCTTLIPGNVKLTAPPPGVSVSSVNSANGGKFSSGSGSLTLTKPSPAPTTKVAVDLCVDLGPDLGGGAACVATTPAALSYLQSLWASPPGTSYQNDPTARATFGVYKGANEFIYLRENY